MGASEWTGWSRAAWSRRGENQAGATLAVFKGETKATVGPDEVGWHAYETRLPPDMSGDGTGR
jgi:hypothetical protein